MERSFAVDCSGAALEPHRNGGRKGDDSRHREGQAVVHHEGHGRRIGRDAGMPWMLWNPEIPRRELPEEIGEDLLAHSSHTDTCRVVS